jgi:hypothetical protein
MRENLGMERKKEAYESEVACILRSVMEASYLRKKNMAETTRLLGLVDSMLADPIESREVSEEGATDPERESSCAEPGLEEVLENYARVRERVRSNLDIK